MATAAELRKSATELVDAIQEVFESPEKPAPGSEEAIRYSSKLVLELLAIADQAEGKENSEETLSLIRRMVSFINPWLPKDELESFKEALEKVDIRLLGL